MSIKVELTPLVGVILNERDIRLGSTKTEVEQALGRPLGRGESAARLVRPTTAAEAAALAALSGPDGPVAVFGGGSPAPAEDLALPEHHWFYYNNELRIDFDTQGRVEFIELLGGAQGTLQPSMDGLELFQAPPEAVYDLLQAKDHGAAALDLNCYCCIFSALELGIYRESVPEDVTELIGEATDEGHPLSPEEIDIENDRTRWAAIGLGTRGYYTA